jgi:hypothetical protein
MAACNMKRRAHRRYLVGGAEKDENPSHLIGGTWLAEPKRMRVKELKVKEFSMVCIIPAYRWYLVGGASHKVSLACFLAHLLRLTSVDFTCVGFGCVGLFRLSSVIAPSSRRL